MLGGAVGIDEVADPAAVGDPQPGARIDCHEDRREDPDEQRHEAEGERRAIDQLASPHASDGSTEPRGRG